MNEDRFLTEREVFDLTGRALSSLRNDRHFGRGFPYIKLGRSVRYSIADVVGYMQDRRITPGAGGDRGGGKS